MQEYTYTQTAKNLISMFSLDKHTINYDMDRLVIHNYPFHSRVLRRTPYLLSDADLAIPENQDFKYIVFSPAGKAQYKKAILLLHGLNERTWNKYLPWASFLSSMLQRPVILFPIAFHMNRSAPQWLEMKSCFRLFRKRSEHAGPGDKASFANTVLSERLEKDPLKFFSSGLQTYMDIIDLLRMLHSGSDSRFSPDTVFHIFGYSIGAFLGEILLMCDPEGLFKQSRMFLFCGGTVLNRMNSGQRTIMDSKAAQALLGIVKKILGRNTKEQNEWKRLSAMAGEKEVLYFKSMLDGAAFAGERNSRLSTLRDRIKAISLTKDKVVPARAVEDILGQSAAETDFPYQYTHEDPFPFSGADPAAVDKAFLSIFTAAVEYLH
ncbi:MAG: hypothetical protein JW874_02840 [Spirochaetales bacterium]|nr:hypothetical protein [Spirochaetales bacterium]